MKNILKIIAGLLIGFANGFFGGGGGMLCVPLLEKVYKESTKTAHATAILVILPLSVASGIVYMINGFLDFYVLAFAGAGVLAGGIVGALLLKIAPQKIIALIFAILMVVAGVKLLF